MDDNLEEIHEELLTWAEENGVEINSIRPMRLSGRGFGIIATDHIPKDTEIMTVPVSALRTRDTVPTAITKSLPQKIPVHGLLAADLALSHAQNTGKYAQWNAVVPSWEDLQLCMPLTWPASLQSHLPTAAANLLAKQRDKFDQDWASVAAAFPLPTRDGAAATCTRAEYLHAWLLVNTRTFYFVTPATERLPAEDHMCLQPVADLLNHTDRGGCHVAFHHADGFTFQTTRAYNKGDEVYISYGRHSNDFLLVEYGFVLPTNAWDEVCLDDVLVPALKKQQKENLEDVGFLGNYILDRETVCHRTQVAVRMLLTGSRRGLPMNEWRRFVDGLDDGEKSQRRVDGLLERLLKDYMSEISSIKEDIKELKFEGESKSKNEIRRELLLRRWDQIEDLVQDTIKRLKQSEA